MCIRNKMASLLFKAGLVLVSALGLLFSSDFLRNMSIFSYYTFLCAAVCLIFYIFVIAWLAVDIVKRGKRGAPLIANHFKGAVIVGLCANILLYLFVMQPSGGEGALAIAGDVLIHFVVPLLALLDWALFDPKGRFYPSDPVVWLLIPYFYYAYVLVRAQIDALYFDGLRYSYPYAFINANSIGWTSVFVNVGVMSLIFLVMGYLLFTADKIMGLMVKRAAPRVQAETEAEDLQQTLRDNEATGATDAFTTSTIVAAMGARRDEDPFATMDREMDDAYGPLPFHPIGRFGSAITPEEVDAVEDAYVEEEQSFAPAARPEPVFAQAPQEELQPLTAPLFSETFEEEFQPQPQPVFADAPQEAFQTQAEPLFAETFGEEFQPQAEPIFAELPQEELSPQAEPLYAEMFGEEYQPQAEPVFAELPQEDLQPQIGPLYAEPPEDFQAQAEPFFAEIPQMDIPAPLFIEPAAAFAQETQADTVQEEPIEIVAGRLHFDYVPQPYDTTYAVPVAYAPPVAGTASTAAAYIVPVYSSTAQQQSDSIPAVQYEFPFGEDQSQPHSFYQAPSAYDIYLQQSQPQALSDNGARSFHQAPEYQIPGMEIEQTAAPTMEESAPQDTYPASEVRSFYQAPKYQIPGMETAQAEETAAAQDVYSTQEAVYEEQPAQAYTDAFELQPTYENTQPLYTAEPAEVYPTEQTAFVAPSEEYYQPITEQAPTYQPFGFEPQQDEMALQPQQDDTLYGAQPQAEPYAQYVNTYLQQPPVYQEYAAQPEVFAPQSPYEPQQDVFAPQDAYEAQPQAFVPQDTYQPQPEEFAVQDEYAPQPETFVQPGVYEPQPEGFVAQGEYAPQPEMFAPQDAYQPQPEVFVPQATTELQPPVYEAQQEVLTQPGYYEAAPAPAETLQETSAAPLDATVPQAPEPLYNPQPEYYSAQPEEQAAEQEPTASEPEEQTYTTLPEKQSISYDPSPEAYYETPHLAVNNSQSSIKGYVVPASHGDEPKGGKSMVVSGFRSPIPRTRRSQKNNAANK